MKIFYEKNGRKIGPVELSEIHSHELSRDTLIWKEGFDDWVRAGEVPELSSYLAARPPVLPSKASRIMSTIDSRYDPDYEREIGVSLFGVFLLLISFAIGFADFEDKDSESFRVTLAWFSTALRIMLVFYVRVVAKEQNRNPLGWSIFTFFLPSIALIVIGLLRKLRVKHGSLPIKHQTNQKKNISRVSDEASANKPNVEEPIQVRQPSSRREADNKVLDPRQKDFESQSYTAEIANLQDSLSRIKKLKDKGVFSDREANVKMAELEGKIKNLRDELDNRRIQETVRQSQDYADLSKLLQEKVLTQQEFDLKVRRLEEDTRLDNQRSQEKVSSNHHLLEEKPRREPSISIQESLERLNKITEELKMYQKK